MIYHKTGVTYETPEELKAKCLEYFNDPEINEGILTNRGLRLYLGVSDDVWYGMSTCAEFKVITDWAKSVAEYWTEKKLLLDNKPVGAIFQLKSAFGRTDQPQKVNETNNYIYVFGNEALKIKRNDDMNEHLIDLKMRPDGVAVPQLTHDEGLVSTGTSEVIATKKQRKSTSSAVRLGVSRKNTVRRAVKKPAKAKPKA